MRTKKKLSPLIIPTSPLKLNFDKMKAFLLLFLVFFFTFSSEISGQAWKSTGALTGAGSATYLIGATAVENVIFVLSMEQNLAYSTNLGETWIKQSAAKPNGTIAAITGIKDRLYASVKLNTYDYELYYSKNNGETWTLDTIGLPENLTKTGKSAMILKYMGDDYVLAHNYQKAVYKKIGDTSWKPTFIDNVIVDISSVSGKWLAIGQGKILQSADKGESWTKLGTAGLPANFQGSLICSNNSRIFVSNPPASGAQDIYYSDDNGATWNLSNSAGKYNFTYPWIQSLFAVNNYVFASIKPGNIQDEPPFLISTSQTPDFTVGDVSGLPTNKTNTFLPFFFQVGNKLFTMFWDLYSFDLQTNNTTFSRSMKSDYENLTVFPNPASEKIQIKTKNMQIQTIEILNVSGQRFFYQANKIPEFMDVSDWKNGIYLIKITATNGYLYQTKFIKN